MKKTPNLELPVYDTPSVDTFRVDDWNKANENIDYVFGELKNNPNVNAIDITARQDIINNHRSVTEQMDSNIQEINNLKTSKVDKVSGKTLSTNDYDNVEKGKVATISSKADISAMNLEFAKKPNKTETGWANFNTFDETTRAILQGLNQGQINAVLGAKNVLNSNINDSEINGRTLDTQYNFKEFLNSGQGLNTIINAGIYLVQNATDKPDGYNASSVNFLIVEKFNSRWVLQTFIDFNDVTIKYKRKIDANTLISTVWNKEIFYNKKVINSSYNIDVLYEDGEYITEGATGTFPNDLSSGLLRVIAYNNNYIYQEITHVLGSLKYFRYINKNNSSVGSWIKIIVSPTEAFVKSTNLTDNYSYRGVIDNTKNIDNLYVSGTYVCVNPQGVLPTNIPSTSFIIDVNTSYNRYVHQTITLLRDNNKRYFRIMDTNSYDGKYVSNWVKILDETDSSALPLTGKTIVHLGDSLTEFSRYDTTVSKLTGGNCLNCGFGGSTMSTHLNQDYNKFSFNQLAIAIANNDFSLQDIANENLKLQGDDNTEFLNRLKSIDFTKVDYVTVSYGTNDYTSGKPIGTVDSENVDEVLGAFNFGLKTMLTKYPNIKIYLVSPLWRTAFGNNIWGCDSDTTPHEGTGKYLYEYVNALEQVAKVNHTQFLNMYYTSGINKYNFKNYLADGIHLTDIGKILYGTKIAKFLLSQ